MAPRFIVAQIWLQLFCTEVTLLRKACSCGPKTIATGAATIQEATTARAALAGRLASIRSTGFESASSLLDCAGPKHAALFEWGAIASKHCSSLARNSCNSPTCFPACHVSKAILSCCARALTLTQVSVPFSNRMDQHDWLLKGVRVHAMRKNKFTEEQCAG